MSDENLVDKYGTVAAQGTLASFTKTEQAAAAGMHFFDVSPQNYAMARFTIARCNDFALSSGLPQIDEYLCIVDLFASHGNEWPIDFKAMFESSDIGSVMQFISGVGLRIDRSTGKFSDGWRGKFHLRIA